MAADDCSCLCDADPMCRKRHVGESRRESTSKMSQVASFFVRCDLVPAMFLRMVLAPGGREWPPGVARRCDACRASLLRGGV